jgi:hypothetical protein
MLTGGGSGCGCGSWCSILMSAGSSCLAPVVVFRVGSRSPCDAKVPVTVIEKLWRE